MGRSRITMAGLMGLILALGVCLGALTHPSVAWEGAAFSLALGSDVAAVIATIASAGRARKAAAGYAVAGWAYLWASLAPGVGSDVGLHLITTPMIEWFYRHGVADPYLFTRIAHSLFTVAAGLAGGGFAWWLSPPDGPGPPTSSR